MTAPNVPLGPTGETEANRRARIQRNLAKLKAAGAPPEDVAEYIASERITPEMEAANTPRTFGENLAGGTQSVLQGLTFNFGDEIAGTLGGAYDRVTGAAPTLGAGIRSNIDEQRASLQGFREAHPKTALGLELAGGIGSGLATAGVGMGRGVPTLGRIAGVTAAGGALAGAGAGEGLADRTKGAVIGGALGAGLGAGAAKLATSGAGDKLAKGGRKLTDFLNELAGDGGQMVDDVLPTPPQMYPGMGAPKTYSVPALRATQRAFGSPDDFAKQRSLLDALDAQGMGGEALAMNVGDDQTVRAVRAAANQPGSKAGQIVNERLAKQGGALGEQVPRDIADVTGVGSTPGPVKLQQMQRELSGKVNARYKAFRERGDVGADPIADVAVRAGGRVIPAGGTIDDPYVTHATAARRAQNEFGIPQPVLDEDLLIPTNHGFLTRSGKFVTREEAARIASQNNQLRQPVGAKGLDAFDVAVSPGPVFQLDDQTAKGFAKYLAAVRQNPELAALPETDARVLDEAFHLLQEDVRRSGRGTSAVRTRGLRELRDRVLDALGEVDPDYKQVTRDYALDDEVGKVAQEAFDTGMGLAKKPVGTATVALSETTSAGQEAMRAGFATDLQRRAGERASNADLGDLAQFRDVARAVVGTPADRQQFVEMFGQDRYQAMVDRLMPKIQAAAQNAAARGNSTTAKQILDALAFGDDATLDALTSLSSGSPAGAMRQFVGKKLIGPLNQAYRLGVGQTAGETADALTTRGTGNIRTLLDMLEELGQTDAARRAATVPVSGAVTRTAVNR